MEVDSHMISDGKFIVQNGKGTLEFPIEQVDKIVALPELPHATLQIAAAAATPISKVAPPSSEDLLISAAVKEGLEPEFVRSVAVVESGLRQQAISPKGARGLMQLMPFTAGTLGVDANLADQNALGGAAFLRQLLIRYHGDSALALAAYNAGPGAVDKYKGVPPFPETRRYIIKVLQEYARQQKAQNERNLQASRSHGNEPAISATAANLREQASNQPSNRRVSP